MERTEAGWVTLNEPFFDIPDAVAAYLIVSPWEDCSVPPTCNGSCDICDCAPCALDQLSARWCEYDTLASRFPEGTANTWAIETMRGCRYERDFFLAVLTGLDAAGNSPGPLTEPDGTLRTICRSPDRVTTAMPAPRLAGLAQAMPPGQGYLGNLCDADLGRHLFAIGRRLGELATPCGS